MDPAAPTDTVYVSVSPQARTCYHVSDDCPNVPQPPLDKERGILADDLKACEICTDTAKVGKTDDPYKLQRALLEADADAVLSD